MNESKNINLQVFRIKCVFEIPDSFLAETREREKNE